jgi:hypothetical protein
MQESKLYKISNFWHCQDKHPRTQPHTWDSFCSEFQKHPARKEKDGPAWSPVSYVPGGARKNEVVEQVFLPSSTSIMARRPRT